jgi:hypothetical protein
LIIYRWRREKPLSQAWVIGSLLLAALISIVTGVTYAYYWSRYPSSDSELFKPDELVLAFGDEAVPDETGRERIGSPNRLVFQQPASAGVGIDFNVRLRVAPITAPGPIQVELSAPQSLEIRTEYRCPASDPVAAAGSACGSVTNHVFEVDWTITPKSISSSDLWIILPPDLRPTTLYGSDWSAFPYIEGRALTWGPGNRGSDAAPKSWPRNPRIIDTEEQYRSKEARREAVRLDAGLPKLFYQAIASIFLVGG